MPHCWHLSPAPPRILGCIGHQYTGCPAGVVVGCWEPAPSPGAIAINATMVITIVRHTVRTTRTVLSCLGGMVPEQCTWKLKEIGRISTSSLRLAIACSRPYLFAAYTVALDV